ncbi:MAG: hypothetical protein IJ529_05390 [Alphaproteobacteria bacterium]|nr:hypothetical protein [Alphaproteobacteria bacterium]
MKKISLLAFLTLGTAISSAQALNCSVAAVDSVCSGYDRTADNCLSGSAVLKCPLDSSRLFCIPSVKTCELGDIVYSDNHCYSDTQNLSETITPVAVVFDVEHKLAIALEQSSQAYQTGVQLINGNTGLDTTYCDISDASEIRPDCEKYDHSLKKYVLNTIRNFLHRIRHSNIIDYAQAALPIVGSGGSDPTTDTCLTEGMYVNYEARGCHITNDSEDKKVTLYAGECTTTMTVNATSTCDYWQTTAIDKGGYANTQGLVAISGKSVLTSSTNPKYAAPAAKYCNAKNPMVYIGDRPCSGTPTLAAGCYTVEEMHWFLPTVGDLKALKTNLTTVNQAIASLVSQTAISTSTSLLASNQAVDKGSYTSAGSTHNTYDYDKAYVVNMGTGNITKVSRATEQSVRCAYYYGDDWKVSGYIDNEAAIGGGTTIGGGTIFNP